MARGQAAVGMHLTNDKALLETLKQIALEVQTRVVMDAIDAASQPVEQAMIANTPESDGSRDKQSVASRSRWAGSRKLKTTIRSVTRRRLRFGVQSGAIGLVGPSYSDGGGHGNLFSKDHKSKVLWGRDSGTVRQVNQFVKRTADETRGRAQTVLISALKSGIDRAAQRATKNG